MIEWLLITSQSSLQLFPLCVQTDDDDDDPSHFNGFFEICINDDQVDDDCSMLLMSTCLLCTSYSLFLNDVLQ